MTSDPDQGLEAQAGVGNGPRPSFGEVLEKLASAQKPGAGVPAYTRWPNRRMARTVTAWAATRRFTPDGVSWAGAALSLVALAVLVLAPVAWWTGLVVAVLMAAGFVLDSVDGQLARVTGQGSPAGEWLDHVIDAVRQPLIHVCVAVALVKNTELPEAWALLPLGFAVVSVGSFISQLLAEQLRRAHDAKVAAGVSAAKASSDGTEGAGTLRSIVLLPVDFGTLCWVFVLWGSTPVFLVAYGALFAFNAGYFVASARRKQRGLREMVLS